MFLTNMASIKYREVATLGRPDPQTSLAPRISPESDLSVIAAGNKGSFSDVSGAEQGGVLDRPRLRVVCPT